MKDYKEKYEQAILRMNKWVEGSEIIEPKEVAEFVFPELKESEDEKIRKELLKVFEEKVQHCFEWKNGIPNNAVIAWLEKQGEHANFRNKIQIDDEVTRNEDGALVNLSQFKRMVKQGKHKPIKWNSDDLLKRNQIMDILQEYNRPELIAWLEKQGEPRVDMVQWKGDNLREVLEFTGKNKNFDKWFTSFEKFEEYVHEHNDIFKIFNEDGSHYEVPVGAWIVKTPDGYNVASKAIFRQTSTVDKLEPRFNVGDWIVEPLEDKPDYLWHIDRIKDDCYWYDAISAGVKIAYANKECHLWTINDAKDGDVLVSEYGNPFMFNGSLNECKNMVGASCGIQVDGTFYIHKLNDNWTWAQDIKPSTKEQRDLLFTKMKEAGYEWDGEKKELKKIEQKPDEDCCKISDDITTIENDMNEYNKGFECGKQRVLKYPEEFNLCEKSAFAWSEEDERNLSIAIQYVYEHGYFSVENWLKSLKERYSWKPSDEQMDALNIAIGEANSFDTAAGYEEAEILSSLYEQLEKLKGE